MVRAAALILAIAQPASPPFTIEGAGDWRCARVLEAEREHPMLKLVIDEWVFGFLTAYNMYAGAPGGNIVGSIGRENATATVRTYCAQNPLASLTEAAVNFAREARRRPN